METDHDSSPSFTSHTLLVRIASTDPHLRNEAWREFHCCYRPIIAGFARRMGARGQDIDDIVQEVLASFTAAASSFVYDPKKGQFRSYLKTCVFRVLRRRFALDARLPTLSLDAAGPDGIGIEQVWNDVWELEHLRCALEATRRQYRCEKTFRAFELHSLLGRPGAEVAQELGMSIDSVYKASERIIASIRKKMHELEEQAG